MVCLLTSSIERAERRAGVVTSTCISRYDSGQLHYVLELTPWTHAESGHVLDRLATAASSMTCGKPGRHKETLPRLFETSSGSRP